MKKICFTAVLLVLTCASFAQDYFSDRNANGTPIVFVNKGEGHQLLFSANVDVSDKSSLKTNIYQQYWLNQKNYNPLTQPRSKQFLGWGLSAKASTTDGLGKVFGSGDFNPGFTGGAYIAFSEYDWKLLPDGKTTAFSNWAIIWSGNLSYANHQLFDPSLAFDDQLSSKTFHGTSGSLSFVKEIYPGKDNLYYGISFTMGRQSNYDDLNSVEIKNDSLISNNGANRTVTQINPKGNVYAEGKYQEYTNYNFRLNACYVPNALNHNVGFLFYPSVDLSSAYSAKYNMGFAFSYLKTGNPSAAVATLFFELDDINNAAGTDKPFMKRAFKVGVSTSLNILTGN